MANLFFTGFEGLNSPNSNTKIQRRFPNTGTAFTTISSAYGISGSGLQVQGNFHSLPINLSTAPTTIFMGFHHKITSVAGADDFLGVYNTANGNHASLGFDATLNKYYVKDSLGNVVGYSPTYITNAWNWVELFVSSSNVSGSIILKVNGLTAVSSSNLDTQIGSSNQINFIYIGNNNSTANYDNLYINDDQGSSPHNTFYGEIRVDAVIPNANSSVQFTPSGSTNVSQIADGNNIDDDSTYNYSNVSGSRDLFTVSGYTAPSSVVLGVVARAIARKNDTGTRTVRTLVKSGTVLTSGSTVALNTGYNEYSQYLYTDPNTGVAFASSSINSLLIGYEIVS